MPHRRRRELRTNYKKRAALVVSGMPRMVVRTSSKHTTVQFVQARIEGDHTLASAKSTELEKFDWKYGGGNLPAAYLTGILAGSRALEKGIQNAILDIGVQRVRKGARIFSALKGAIDAGIEIPHKEKILPEHSRIKGEHIAAYARELSSDAERYKAQFSRYLSRKLTPEDLPSSFEKAREKISGSEKKPQKKSDKK
jgi:large subunit ribosomal protein L18